MTSLWLNNLPNVNQSSDERRAKYHIARMHQVNYSHARRVRDWRWSKIARRFGFQSVDDLLIATGVEVLFYMDESEAKALIE